jgi:DNA-binding response OmpR family regulator
MRIMIVEDDVDIREIVHEFLTAQGHVVDAVSSGREAIDSLRNIRRCYDVALVDWQLPGISGRDVIHTIASRSPSTAILITTGLPRNSRLIHRANLESQVDILQKPFSLRTLHRRLMDAVATRQIA